MHSLHDLLPIISESVTKAKKEQKIQQRPKPATKLLKLVIYEIQTQPTIALCFQLICIFHERSLVSKDLLLKKRPLYGL